MSKRVKRKSRDNKREWRYTTLQYLMRLLHRLDIKSVDSLNRHSLWDMVCKWDKR
jgi:hypothetical protein